MEDLLSLMPAAAVAPWLLALLLGGLTSALWFFTVATFLRADAWMEEGAA